LHAYIYEVVSEDCRYVIVQGVMVLVRQIERRCFKMATETRRHAREVSVSIVDGNQVIYQATTVSQSKMVTIKLLLPAAGSSLDFRHQFVPGSPEVPFKRPQFKSRFKQN
jgi:hypothetical protein